MNQFSVSICGGKGGERILSRIVMKWPRSLSSLVKISARFVFPSMCLIDTNSFATDSLTAFSRNYRCRMFFEVFFLLH